MKIRKIITALIIFFVATLNSYAEISLKLDDIPKDIPENVRNQIRKLYVEDGKSRRRAITALGKMGEKAAPAIPYLIALFADDTMMIKYTTSENHKSVIATYLAENVAKSVGNIGKAAVAPLIDALDNKDPNIRRYSARALGFIKDRVAIEELIYLLTDENILVRKYAAGALSDITREELSEERASWEEWWGENMYGPLRP